jgi:hypothetical protein
LPCAAWLMSRGGYRCDVKPIPNLIDAIALRPSIPALLSTTIAAVGVGGIIVVASATKVGSTPGNGERVFDAPGCQPNEYDGPGHVPRYPSYRGCPAPTPVIVVRTTYASGVWHVTWDGSRSFDPVGERILRYAWSGGGRKTQILGPRISVLYNRPGTYSVELHVTDYSGLTGTARETVQLR